MTQEQSNQSETKPAFDFKPFAPGYAEDPFPAIERLREATPIFYWDEGRSWVITRYHDVSAVFRDERFAVSREEWESSAEYSSAIPELSDMKKYGLFGLPPEDHARVRKLVNPSFTSRAIDLLRAEIQRTVDQLLDARSGQEEFDVVRDYAEGIPMRAISALLKVPAECDEKFRRFGSATARALGVGLVPQVDEETKTLVASVTEGLALLHGVLDERRRNPLENDVLTMLLQAEADGSRLSTKELVALVGAIIAAGTDTTIYLIAFAVLNLLRSPEALELVKAEPGLMRNALDEVLRFDNILRIGTVRFARQDLEYCGASIKKGEMVFLLIPSALRDGTVFSRPDVFDVRRDTSASLAYGRGPHVCPGVSLARLEAEIAVGTIFRRFPEMKLKETPVFGYHPAFRNIESLNVILKPSKAG
ncbi:MULTISPECIES: cytochrome P450 [Sorangium]|uniref:Cytochrome P450 n=1 Tax=Sorangium cellulosum TaxID=56 RepID=A0A4P2QU99_SORCE|nr:MULTISPECIES: cytochrome P450 [Sorangium]AUX33103.1 cytochrome P450 [Sorangium cellulosum]WCQ92477.1 Epothilone C/D epoxidase [Sorangium sp. Soce836]